MKTIQIIDPDENSRMGLIYTLRKGGYEVINSTDGPSGVELFQKILPDFVILELLLTGFDGFEVCRRIRRISHAPIIFLSSRSDEIDMVVGLELGADDYIIKPYRMRELLARIAAILRRSETSHLAAPKVFILRAGDLVLDPVTHTVTRQGQLLALKPRAFALLHFFMQHPGQVFPREQLLQQLWGNPFIGDPRTVDVHIRWIREQIEDNPAMPVRLRTLRGVGYQFVE